MTLKKLSPNTSEHSIQYPQMDSEFEIQAYLFAKLKAAGFDVRGEVQVHGMFGLRKAKASCRFDIVIYENGVATLIIEVKARVVNHKSTVDDTRQGKRYTTFGVPVWFVYGMSDAEKALDEIRTL